jgi:hypothetical protein
MVWERNKRGLVRCPEIQACHWIGIDDIFYNDVVKDFDGDEYEVIRNPYLREEGIFKLKGQVVDFLYSYDDIEWRTKND